MAISANNEKLGVMEMDNLLEPGLPLSPGTFGQDDKQQLIWGYPGVLWQEPVIPVVAADALGRMIVVEKRNRLVVMV